ncbi:MAG: iron ABC transporter permease [Alphaproteobacteria bacterium]|nr:iron ABC transporter permease [Alphaproteobacteria bacterium]
MSRSVDAAVSGAADSMPPRSLSERYRRFQFRRMVWLAAFLGMLAGGFVVNVASGPAGLSVPQVIEGLIDPDGLSSAMHVIIWDVRLPFAVMAIVVGACLGLAGAEMQTVLNNPLASPATLGISYAATLGASIAIAFDLAGPFGLPEDYVTPLFAFLGAIAAMALIQLLSRLYGASLEIVILFGIAMVFALQALVSLIQFVADSNSLQQIVFWTMGSLARATWQKIAIITVVLAVCGVFSMAQVWRLTALRGGEEYARSAGVQIERLRLLTLFRVSIVAAVAVSFTGVIGFVGLVGPHIARLVCGEDHRFFLPGSVLAGAIILTGASIASKSIIPGIIIPDGIVTALVGVPMFLVLVLTQMRKGRR